MPVVFYHPAPYPDGEARRQAVVDRLLALDLDSAELARVAREVANLFDAPMSAVTVLDRDRQWLMARVGLKVAITSRAVSFCGHAIHLSGTFCVEDAHLDPRFAGNPLVTGSPSIRFYAGAPIVVEGEAIGALCALGTGPRLPTEGSRLERLAHLASHAASHLEAQLSGRQPDKFTVTSRRMAAKLRCWP